MTTEEQEVIRYVRKRLAAGHIKKGKSVIFLDDAGHPYAVINARGVFGAAQIIDGRTWYSYPPNDLEEEFFLNTIRLSRHCDVLRYAVSDIV